MRTEYRQPSEPKQLTESVEKLQARLDGMSEEKSTVITAERLRSLYGLGDEPALTAMLFSRLERKGRQNGPQATKIIRSCIRSAQSADNPLRYFAAAVTRRLRENGFG